MKKSIVIVIILFQGVVCFSQQNSYFFFYLVNSGRKPTPKHGAVKDIVIDSPMLCVLNYNNEEITGKFTIKKAILHIDAPDKVRDLHFGDTAIRSIRIFHEGALLFLKMINTPRGQQLRRVLQDTLGFAVYDDVFSFSRSVDNVDYDELIFEYDGKSYVVTDFWTTSRKRKMIDILNHIFKSDLKYNEYRSKESLLESILKLENRAAFRKIKK